MLVLVLLMLLLLYMTPNSNAAGMGQAVGNVSLATQVWDQSAAMAGYRAALTAKLT